MPDMPTAEITIDARLVRRLLERQASPVMDAAKLPLTHAADGWDCSVWRLGDRLAVRLPRRAIAAPLILHEQRWLPSIAARLGATAVAVPAPVFAGGPDAHLGYPWSWSVVPWLDGTAGLHVPRAARAGWTGRLAAALARLHSPAPADAPANPYRGVPLAERDDAMRERLDQLAALGGEASVASLRACWQKGLDAAAWAGPPVWIHGDLHPGNIVAQGGHLVGIIDFGDLTAGDPAYDLAVAWLAFGADGRAGFRGALDGRYDAATWARARGWAAAVTAMLLAHSDDNPVYAALGEEARAEFAAQ